MTTAQYQKRQRHKAMVAELKRQVAVLRREADLSRVAELDAKRALQQADKYVVRLGVERGFLGQDVYQINISIHPQEFRYAMMTGGVENISYCAARIGDELGHKVTQALIDFMEGKLKR